MSHAASTAVVAMTLRRAEYAEHAVAYELVRVAAMPGDQRHDEIEELVQLGHRLAGTRTLGERREAADVDEQHRDLHVLALDQLTLGHDALGHARIDVRPECGLQPIALLEAGHHLVEAVRELADLVGRSDRRARGEVAPLDALGDP